MRIGNEYSLPVAIHNVRRHANHRGIRRYIRQHYRTRAHARVFAHGDVAEHICIVADEYAIANGRVALAMPLPRSAQSDALVHGHVTAHDCGFADHNAGCVIDEEPWTEQSARMNVNAGKETAHLRQHPRQ